MEIKSIQDYYDHSWHDTRRGTNNRLESINQKFKQVIERFASFEQFFHDL